MTNENGNTKLGLMLAISTGVGILSALLVLRLNRRMSIARGAMESERVSVDVDDAANYETQADDYQDITPEDDEVIVYADGDIEAATSVRMPDLNIGDGEGEVSRRSKAYRELINVAYMKSLEDETVTVVLTGKTNGVGARGEWVDAEDHSKGRVYDADAIGRMRQKMLDEGKAAATQGS